MPGYDSKAGPSSIALVPNAANFCASLAAPQAWRREGRAKLETIDPPVGGAAGLPALMLSRSLSAGGKRVFFETQDKLVAADTNGDLGCAPWGSSNQGILDPHLPGRL